MIKDLNLSEQGLDILYIFLSSGKELLWVAFVVWSVVGKKMRKNVETDCGNVQNKDKNWSLLCNCACFLYFSCTGLRFLNRVEDFQLLTTTLTQGNYWRGMLYAVHEMSWFMVISFKCCKLLSFCIQ